ncbi:MAG: HDOD domain-containing protein [Deltaproteobacteria bacterium]|nr:HDOD domain-containing protein [Deltaproteobacteria bacterium]
MKLIRQLLDKIERLPAMPGVARFVLEQTSDPDFSMEKLVKVVSLDPGITANVLRVCNSPFFGLRNKAASLTQAIPLIGVNNLLDVVLSSGISQFFQEGQNGYRLARGQLWRHSMATALVAKHLAQLINFGEVQIVYTGALLHDAGKLVLSEFVEQRFHEIERLVAEEGAYEVYAEKQVLGVDHAQLGGLMAKKWKFPISIRECIIFHHTPQKAARPRTVTNLVSLANYLAVKAGHGGGMDEKGVEPPQTAILELPFSREQILALPDQIKALLVKAESLLALAS